jgi:hypothetical protein
VLADDFVEALGGQRCAEQVVSRLGGGFDGGFAHADQLADRRQAGPAMVVLQPGDVGRDRGGTGLDAAVIGIDDRCGGDGLGRRIVEVRARGGIIESGTRNRFWGRTSLPG